MRRVLAPAAPLLALAVCGCALLTPLPDPASVESRLAALPAQALPLERPVAVHWDAHMIPFIEAETDADLAFALGLVHAHLRLAQMEVMRRVATGRIAEMAGLPAIGIDRSLRILDLDRAVPESWAAMPPETRAWVQRYVDGINHYVATVPDLPHEFAVLGLTRERWRPEDVLALGRLAAIDPNWFTWFRILALRQDAAWSGIWARLTGQGGDAVTARRAGAGGGETLAGLLAPYARSGSNSVVVAGRRTAAGGALMANDPHLGIMLPNVWLVAGIKSPSYHAVGLMVPGLPGIALGRNPWIAWGGTNMRAASSDLVDIRDLPTESIAVRREPLRVRWWADVEATIRDTAYGPVLSDAPALEAGSDDRFALRWTGHAPSDELTPFLAVNRARDFAAFQAAFRDYAVAGQTMLYADAAGNIGSVMAVRLPQRPADWRPSDLVVPRAATEPHWQGFRGTADLPHRYNPPEGIIASANDRPDAAAGTVGYFFAPPDRVRRLANLADTATPVTAETLMDLQQDVFQASSLALRDALLARIDALPGTWPDAEAATIGRLRGWDGHYRAGDAGPVAFELLLDAFATAAYGRRYGAAREAWLNHPDIKRLMLEDIADMAAENPAALAGDLRQAVAAAASQAGAFPDWGSMHRLELAHSLANIPLLGGRYRFFDAPAGGTTDTVMKTAHALTGERHATRYGANARHISDMSDPDRNWFVLLGGQDGWLNSAAFLDQAPLWQKGRYIQVPLRIETVRARFPYRTALQPAM